MDSIAVIGVNHESAPLRIREKLTFDTPSAIESSQEILALKLAKEVLVLSTCNRTELYFSDGHPKTLIKWLAEHKELCHNDLLQFSYTLNGVEALKHSMRVASGLNSMILGEVEILGQFKKTFLVFVEAKTLGRKLNRLFQTVFKVAKIVRSSTGIGLNPLSISSIAAKLPKLLFAKPNELSVLLVGAGELMSMMAERLNAQGIQNLFIANRTFSKAESLAKHWNATPVSLENMPEYLKNADVLITGTGSPLPIVGKGMVESAIRHRKHRPMMMIDLAVPRNIEPEVKELEDIYLYNVDDLQNIAQDNKRQRENYIQDAEKIIEAEAEKFAYWIQNDDSFKMVSRFREQFEKIKAETLNESLKSLSLGENPEIVLNHFAQKITNRFLHGPTRQMRLAMLNDEKTMLSLLLKLFELEQHETFDLQ